MRTEKALGIGALLAGTLASLCCVGPLVFGVLGLGAFGAGAFFDSARPFFAAVLSICGVFGLLLIHRKRQVIGEDGSCKVKGASLATKALMWAMVGIGCAFYFFPYYL